MDDDLRPIPGIPDYFASPSGRIWSTKGRGRWLKPSSDRRGYQRVSVVVAGRSCTRAVHQLIAEAFHGPRPEGMEVCHNDGDPANNTPDNLRWDTHANNMAEIRKTHCPAGHPYTRYENGLIACRTCARERWRAKHPPKKDAVTERLLRIVGDYSE